MTCVLDASVTLAWLMVEDNNPAALRILESVAITGAVVPGLWTLEVSNALCVAMRRGRCDRDYVAQSLERLARLPIAIDTETQAHAWGEITDLAQAHGLTTYDAAYLELALRRGIPLASFDKALSAAARRSGVDVLSA